MQILERISERITVPTVITAFDGEYTSDILLSILYFLLYLFLFFSSLLPCQYTHTDTQLAEGGKVVKRVWERQAVS